MRRLINPLVAIATIAVWALVPPQVLGALVVPDGVFGWGAHALCLGLGPIVGMLVVASMRIAVEYGRIPIALSNIRARSNLGADAESHIRAFEHFILACGAGHALRAIALFVPILTIVVLIVDIVTVSVSAGARRAIAAAADEMVAQGAALDQAEVDREAALARVEALKAHIERLQSQ